MTEQMTLDDRMLRGGESIVMLVLAAEPLTIRGIARALVLDDEQTKRLPGMVYRLRANQLVSVQGDDPLRESYIVAHPDNRKPGRFELAMRKFKKGTP